MPRDRRRLAPFFPSPPSPVPSTCSPTTSNRPSHRPPSRRPPRPYLASFAFYGRGCQDTLSPIARRCPFDIRRPLPSVSKSLDSDLGSRTGTSRWRGNGLMRQHVEHREDDLVWGRRSGRLASQLVLVDPTTGTILLSGPRWAMASFGTPRGHSLRVGTPNDFFGSSQTMDTLPRTFLVP